MLFSSRKQEKWELYFFGKFNRLEHWLQSVRICLPTSLVSILCICIVGKHENILSISSLNLCKNNGRFSCQSLVQQCWNNQHLWIVEEEKRIYSLCEVSMFTFAIVLQIFLKKELHSLCEVVCGVGDDVDVAGEPRRLHWDFYTRVHLQTHLEVSVLKR